MMLTRTRLSIAAVAGSAAMALGLIGAGPASAQPVITGGLVNVTLVDVADVNNNNIQIPIGVAAQVGACVDLSNTQIGVLSAQEITQTAPNDLSCTIEGDQQFQQIPIAFQRQAF
jgi:hypothetical protein